jgi:hypothetical protein
MSDSAVALSTSLEATSFADDLFELLSDSIPLSRPAVTPSKVPDSGTRKLTPSDYASASQHNSTEVSPTQTPAPVEQAPALTTLPTPAPTAGPLTAPSPILPPVATVPVSPICYPAAGPQTGASQTPVPMNSASGACTPEDFFSKAPILAFAARLTAVSALDSSHSSPVLSSPVRMDCLAGQPRSLPPATVVPPASLNPNAQIPSNTTPAVLAPRAIATSKPAGADPQPAELTAAPKTPDPQETQPTPTSQPQAGGRVSAASEAKPAAHAEIPDAQQAPVAAINVAAAMAVKPGIEPAAPFQAPPRETAHESLPAAQPAPLASPVQDDTEAVPTQPLRDLSIRITNEISQTADVRMVERNGEIQVAVRASDPVLANSLRSDLGDLVRNLSPTGLTAEVWHPGVTPQTGAASDARQQDARGGSFSQQRSGQDFQQSGSRQRQGGRQQPPWLEELESIPGGSQIRRKNS